MRSSVGKTIKVVAVHMIEWSDGTWEGRVTVISITHHVHVIQVHSFIHSFMAIGPQRVCIKHITTASVLSFDTSFLSFPIDGMENNAVHSPTCVNSVCLCVCTFFFFWSSLCVWLVSLYRPSIILSFQSPPTYTHSDIKNIIYQK